MTDKKPLRLPSARLVAIAAVAGVLSGAGVVAFRHIGSESEVQVAAVADAGLCEGASTRIASLKPFLKGQVAAMSATDKPRVIPLSFKGPEAKDMTLADLGGKTVLLNLWATWCVPCREEMPALNALEKEKGGPDFEVVAVNIDTGSDDKPNAFMSEYNIDALKLYRDSSMGVFNVLKKEGLAFGLPATLILDGNGCLLAAMNGPAAWDSEDAKALVSAAK
ncbi:thiol:disulfide interchange protein TlpA [Rhizobium sp. RM]|uniref:thiol:disulfide interchange protein TlpA n=1 Tax=Rhizobium/Agrobacterium group TaxID=227290 RepID=UPI00110EF3BD|nr:MULTISPECIES: TlpA disulfide reductase family protein [Rhizobium/Agrobacterium group]NWJ24091.1 TlpA family protein disulfide reductase [Rhizobium sp. RM]TMV21339.1 TlpA family protein disulfide reductase [Rhizobium sp. Td3]UXS04569.1 TlpA family protein disulfide reductase [Agrobacterium tumefaciens]